MQLGLTDPFLAAQAYAARKPAADPRLAMPAFARALEGEAAPARANPDPPRRPPSIVQSLDDSPSTLAERKAAVRHAEAAGTAPPDASNRPPAAGSFLDLRV